MAINSNLQSFLQTLVNTPEAEKRAVLRSLIKALQEACRLFYKSEYQEIAKKTQKTLENILESASNCTEEFDEEEWEEEFVESGTYREAEAMVTEPKLAISKEPDDSPESRLTKTINRWNANSPSWLKMIQVSPKDSNSVISFIRSVAALRSNFLSNSFDEQEEITEKFERTWQDIVSVLNDAEYSVLGEDFSVPSGFQGKDIYTCRPRISEREEELICPGVSYQGNLIQEPVRVIAFPLDADFPEDHMLSSHPSHWRGIFGELEILLEHIEMQKDAFCAIEGINKNKIEPIDKCQANLHSEVRRRGDVVQASIQKEGETVYRLATDYWRVEECFWSIFHDDDRPGGCSYFDRLRTRLQAWRTTLRRSLKFYIRDFACGIDSLASINKYIGNIILKRKKNVAPSTVIRELRPAIVVKDQGASRLLKGRVVST